MLIYFCLICQWPILINEIQNFDDMVSLRRHVQVGANSLFIYFSALTKSTGLRTEGKIDERSFWINYVSSISAPLAIPLVYPRMMAIHDLDSKVIMSKEYMIMKNHDVLYKTHFDWTAYYKVLNPNLIMYLTLKMIPNACF